MILRKFQWFWWFLKKKLRKFQKSLKVWKPKKSHWLTGSSSDRLRGNCLQMSRRLQPPKNIENNLFTKGKFHVFDKNQCFSYGKSRGGCWRKWHPPPPTFWFQEIRDGGLPSGHSYPQEHFSPFHLFNSMGRYKMREHTFFMKNHKNKKK